MIRNFVDAFRSHKVEFRKWVMELENEIEYKDILKEIITLCNPDIEDAGLRRFDKEHIVEVDDGDYQGTLIYLMPEDRYQPDPEHYIWTYVWYGSCSGCDALMGAWSYDVGYDVDEVTAIALHLVERMKWLVPQDEESKGCMDCMYELYNADQEPCVRCKRAYKDNYKPKDNATKAFENFVMDELTTSQAMELIGIIEKLTKEGEQK